MLKFTAPNSQDSSPNLSEIGSLLSQKDTSGYGILSIDSSQHLGNASSIGLDNYEQFEQAIDELQSQVSKPYASLKQGADKMEFLRSSPSDNSDADILTGLSKADSLVAHPASSLSPMSTVSGSLDITDAFNPSRIGSYKDDYLLSDPVGGLVQIDLNSSEIDTYLQVVDSYTGEVIAYDDDGGSGTDSQLSFTTVAGASYIVRATSYYPFELGGYTVSIQSSSSPAPAPGEFDSTYGYGLVDAAAAVSSALNTSSFADVPDLGGNNWGNDMVNAPETWAAGYTGQNVVVAVVDTGVDYTHTDLDGNIWTNSDEIAGNGIDDDQNGYVDDITGWDFVNGDNDAMDDDKHGTHVAGTIAAENNSEGISGVAYNAKIMPVKVLAPDGGSNEAIASGIRYAADNGADVINLSLGGSYSTEIEAAVQYATEMGAVVVMSAGNDRLSQPGYPAQAATDWGLAVGAVNSNRTIADFSNRAGSDSRMQYVVAPGEQVYSTVPGNTYSVLDGTSMAAPHVAGVVALMLSANPNLTPDQVRQMITESAVGLSGDASFSTIEQSIPDQSEVEQSGAFSALTTAETTIDLLEVTHTKLSSSNAEDQSTNPKWTDSVTTSVTPSNMLISTVDNDHQPTGQFDWQETILEQDSDDLFVTKSRKRL